MFNQLTPVPADPILGLITEYNNDPRLNKIDLGVGVYKNAQGQTPVLNCVKTAEQYRTNTEQSKTYIGPQGSASFNQLITELIFNVDHPAYLSQRIRTISTPGGTGSLRAAAELISYQHSKRTIWVSDPTWNNHISLFEAVGLTVKTYPYYDKINNQLLFDEMLATLEQVNSNDVVLLHACCHNPSGQDLSQAQWDKVVEVTQARKFTPLIDMAYLGFGENITADAYGLRTMAANVDELILCSSCSKNFGLYRERIGACSVIAKDSHHADIALSILLNITRVIYSMPPAHGAALVETILASTELKQQWLDELKLMRDRINNNRIQLVNKLTELNVKQDFSFIADQKGMFSFLGISEQQVQQLKHDFGIYMVNSSRMNIAGFNDDNVDYLAKSIAHVL